MGAVAEVGNIVEELMIGEGGVGGVFSHLFSLSKQPSNLQSSGESRQSITLVKLCNDETI